MAYGSNTLSPVQRIQYAAMAYANRPTANSTAAIIIWLLGAMATKTFLQELGIGTGVGGSPLISNAMALVGQAILTLLEGPVWHPALRQHQTRLIIGSAALLIDIGLNVGGCWAFLQNLGNTTLWHAIAAASNSDSLPSSLTTVLLSLAVASLISAAPEALWDL